MLMRMAVELGNTVEQGESLFFKQVEASGCYNYYEATGEAAEGFIKQFSFGNKFCVEAMDYQFNCFACKHYHMPAQFIEMIYLESAGVVNRERGIHDFSVDAGINIYLNQGNPGKLIFSPGIPVRGIRIIVFEAFYQNYLKDRFPEDMLNIPNLTRLNNQSYSNPALQLIFEQIKHSLASGIASELYYESKIAEILYLLTSGADAEAFRIKNGRRRLSREDFEAINKAKSLMDENLSHPPRISELAFLTNTSAAKLQSDFQLAFGSTIHDYLQKTRMKEAVQQIESTEEPIYSIARSVGFKKSGRFAELFKKSFGMTPTEYRKLHHPPMEG